MFDTGSNSLNIQTGINAIGIYTEDTVAVADVGNEEVNVVKTVKSGVWKSWTKDTPELYQGFVDLESGLGYIVVSEGDVVIPLPSKPLEINNIEPTVGISVVALPFMDKQLKTNYIGRMKVFDIRTYDNGWKSWTENTPEEFQGFIDIDYKKGYVVNVDDVNVLYLDAGLDTLKEFIDWGEVIANETITAPIGFDFIKNFNFSGTYIKSLYELSYDTSYSMSDMLFMNTNTSITYDIELILSFSSNVNGGVVGDVSTTSVFDNGVLFNYSGTTVVDTYTPLHDDSFTTEDILFLDTASNSVIDDTTTIPNIFTDIDVDILESGSVISYAKLFNYSGTTVVNTYIPAYDDSFTLGKDIIFKPIETNIQLDLSNSSTNLDNSFDNLVFSIHIPSVAIDDTALLSSSIKFESWGYDVTTPLEPKFDLNVTPVFVPNSGTIYIEFMYNEHNFIDNF